MRDSAPENLQKTCQYGIVIVSPPMRRVADPARGRPVREFTIDQARGPGANISLRDKANSRKSVRVCSISTCGRWSKPDRRESPRPHDEVRRVNGSVTRPRSRLAIERPTTKKVASCLPCSRQVMTALKYAIDIEGYVVPSAGVSMDFTTGGGLRSCEPNQVRRCVCGGNLFATSSTASSSVSRAIF